MSFELSVAIQYLKSRRHKTLPSISATISAAGITLGVAALIVVLSVMSGFSSDMRDKMLGTNSHIIITSQNGTIKNNNEITEMIINSDSRIVGATPFIANDVMVSSKSSVAPLRIIGIDPDKLSQTRDVEKYIVDGKIHHITTPPIIKNGQMIESKEVTHGGIILGDALAFDLSVITGEFVNVVSPLNRMGPMGSIPKMKRFKVVGTFKSGMYDYDSKYGYVDIKAAQRLFDLGDNIGGIEVKVTDIFAAASVAKTIERNIGYPYIARDWMTLNRNIFHALKLERVMIAILLTCIIIVASFGIVSSLSMLVIEKKRDIAILKTLGATKFNIMKIFIYNGLIIGIFGTVLGEVLAYIFCILLKKYQFIELPTDVYNLATLPVEMSPFDFIWIAIATILISVFATIYPSYKAVKLDPVEGLRNA